MHEIVLGGRCSSGGNPVALALAGKTAICVPMATAAPRTSPPAAETRLLLALLPVGGKGLGLDSSFMMANEGGATTHDTDRSNLRNPLHCPTQSNPTRVRWCVEPGDGSGRYLRVGQARGSGVG